jgi:hypothetical protein
MPAHRASAPDPHVGPLASYASAIAKATAIVQCFPPVGNEGAPRLNLGNVTGSRAYLIER